MKDYLIALLTNYLGLFLSIAIQVFLLPFLLNNMGARMTGLYYLFMTVSNFVAVGISWLTGAGVYFLASSGTKHNETDIQETHWAVFLGYTGYATFILIIISVGALKAGDWWLCDAEPSLVREGCNACFILGLYIWVTYLHFADITLLTATLQQGWANFYRVVSQLIFVGGVVIFVISEPRLDLLMLVNLAGSLLAAVAARLHLRISGKLEPFKWHLPDTGLLKQVFLTKGSSYFIFGVAQFGLIYGDVLIIGAILGSEKVAAYLVIWKIPEVIALILGRISEILSPYLTRIESRQGSSSTADVFLCVSRLLHCLGLIAGFAYALFGPSIVGLWVGEANRPDVSWYYWLAGAVLVIQVVNRHDIVLHYALAKLGNLVFAQFAELILKALLTIILFKWLGIIAPLVAALTVQLFGLTWLYRTSALKQVNSNWKDWFSKVGVWLFAVSAAIGAGSFAICQIVPKGGNTSFIISICIYTCIAVMSVYIIEMYQAKNGIFNLHKMLSKA
ncbi:MAG: hypothetical protein GY795_09895 [Desulfobacterales bacterium]|nr:hypothetical protein [Desulfobacterales bacterium]